MPKRREKCSARDSVDLAELREICDDIVTEDNRAAEVIRRLGALYKRGDMKMEPLDLNELIRETLDLLRAELLTRHVAPRTDLAPALPIDRRRAGAAAAGAAQPDPQCRRRDERDRRRGARASRSAPKRPAPTFACTSSTTGRALPPDDLKHVFDAVLEHQGRRHGHRARDLPIDRRGASRHASRRPTIRKAARRSASPCR